MDNTLKYTEDDLRKAFEGGRKSVKAILRFEHFGDMEPFNHLKNGCILIIINNSAMDRTIKFRVWSLKNNCWCYPVLDITNNFNIKNKDSEYQYVFMQFTGLYDSEGKEVWEKDVVEVEIFGTIKQYVILWRNDFFCWAYLPIEYAKKTLDGWGDAFESQLTYQHKPKLLGNIYQHKYLIVE